jgi:chorismate mutase/prephenate dehydrogenase
LAIDTLRQQIDQLDIELVELLAKRQAVTAKVGEYKKQVGKPIYDPIREAELISKRRELAEQLTVNPDLIEDVLRRIMRESYQSQHNAYRCMTQDRTKVVVIGGLGALGKRFVDMFERSNFEVQIIDKHNISDAGSIVEGAKLVLVAVPIDKTVEVISHLPKLPDDCILADLTSLKHAPLNAMLEAHGGPVVGLHPMFGPDVPNFVKQVFVVCHGRHQQEYQWLLEQIKVWGAVIQEDEAKQHDLSMEIIQAMRHFNTFVYGKFLRSQSPDLANLLSLSSPIYRLELAMTGRLFAQDGNLYADIIFGAEHALKLVKTFHSELEQAITTLEQNDKDAFKQQFKQVAEWFGDYSQQFLDESRALLKTAQDNRQY